MKIVKFNEFINENQTPETEVRPDFKFLFNASIFVNAETEQEAEQILINIEEANKEEIQFGFFSAERLPNVKTDVEPSAEEVVEEGLLDSAKKLVGQLKEWKLDGSYLAKASQEAKKYLASHPAAKNEVQNFIKAGCNEEQAKEAVLHRYDWGGKPGMIKFDKNTLVCSVEPPKGIMKHGFGA